MDELRLLTELRRDPPPMTPSARRAARDRLLAATAGTGDARRPVPRRAHDGRRPGRLTWRVAIAGGLGVAIVAALALAPAFDAGRPGGAPELEGLLPGTAVANAAELGALAADAVKGDPTPRPTQWVYLKTSFAPSGTTEEAWHRVDGRLVATNHGGEPRVHDNAKFPRLGPEIPADPAEALAFLRREVASAHGERVAGLIANRPPSKALDERQVDRLVFHTIGDVLRIEQLPPATQGVLYRTLPLIPGVTVHKEVEDASGRPGVAFALTDGSVRGEIILDARTLRYLAWQTVAEKDLAAQPVKLPPGARDKDGKAAVGFPGARVGAVLDAAVVLEKAVVDRPGQRG